VSLRPAEWVGLWEIHDNEKLTRNHSEFDKDVAIEIIDSGKASASKK
jgi:hypothetical protein